MPFIRESVPFLGHIVGRRGLECDPKKIEDVKLWPVPDCLKSVATVSGICGILPAFYPEVCRCRDAVGAFDGEGMCRLCGTPVVQLLSRLCVLH